MLKLFNTLTQRLQEFKPIELGKVRIYVCGLTTYDYAHLGHARMLVVFDVIVKYLRARGYKVTYVRNITDIDDKIINRATENNELFSELTARFIQAMHEDEHALNIARPDQEPRATEHIDQMIAMIEKLIRKDSAYRASNGDVYFAVKQFSPYGRLSRINPSELLEGARVEVGELKRDPRDFTLWKAAAEGEVGWDSPWGYGRPGWHIECSAMSTAALGKTFDIHGGGSDLMFPHHENEIAQSECATGKPFVNYWLHNGPLRIDGDKMAKSLDNFFTIRDVLAHHHPEVVRHLLIASHYRSPINYSDTSLQQSAETLQSFYHALKGLNITDAKTLANSHFEKAFNTAMDDDFNTPQAISVLFELTKELNTLRRKIAAQESGAQTRHEVKAAQLGTLLIRLGGTLGILQCQPEEFLRWKAGNTVDPAEVEQLIAAREQARATKDWKAADAIRDRLAAMNVVVEDSDGSSTWRVGE
ncbi:MAG: cysteine--tRNA ligase [Pseudohongiellaceae bacterium]